MPGRNNALVRPNKAEADAEAKADAEANAEAASKLAKQQKKSVGTSPNKAKKASQKKYVIPNKDDVLRSFITDGSVDKESYVDKDNGVDVEDDAGEKKRKTDAHNNLDIEDKKSSDSDMADTFYQGMQANKRIGCETPCPGSCSGSFTQ